MEWLNGIRPDYRAGQEVWVVYVLAPESPRKVKSVVRTVPASYFNDGAREWLSWDGWYDLSTFTWPENHPPTWAFKWYVFDNQRDATAAAKWWPCKFSDEEWLQAIGDRDIRDDRTGNIHEPGRCDLPIGTVNDGTSRIRSELSRCRKVGGMMNVDRLRLADMIVACEYRPEALGKPDSALGKVLAALDLQWPNKENA